MVKKRKIKNVLIIDDEIMIINLFKRVLENMGYKVRTASSGEEGLKILKNKIFDLIFLDIRMTGMDGYAVFNSMDKENQDNVVFLSGDTLSPEAYHFSRTHNIPFIKKPIGIDELKDFLSSISTNS